MPDFSKGIVFAYANSNITNKPDTIAMGEHTYYYIRQRYEERADIKYRGMGRYLLHAEDLKFSDGNIDANYIHNKVNNKRDYINKCYYEKLSGLSIIFWMNTHHKNMTVIIIIIIRHSKAYA